MIELCMIIKYLMIKLQIINRKRCSRPELWRKEYHHLGTKEKKTIKMTDIKKEEKSDFPQWAYDMRKRDKIFILRNEEI